MKFGRADLQMKSELREMQRDRGEMQQSQEREAWGRSHIDPASTVVMELEMLLYGSAGGYAKAHQRLALWRSKDQASTTHYLLFTILCSLPRTNYALLPTHCCSKGHVTMDSC